MTLVPKNFFGDLFDDWMDYPFGRVFSNSNNSLTRRDNVYAMKTDIVEKDGYYELDMDLPGYKKENINVELENGYLTITASDCREDKQEDKNGNYIRKERYCGTCSRKFFVGEKLSQEDIKAQFSNGILHLVFPKEPPKQIEQTKTINIED